MDLKVIQQMRKERNVDKDKRRRVSMIVQDKDKANFAFSGGS